MQRRALGMTKRSELPGFIQNRGVGRYRAFFRVPQVHADLENQRRHVVEQVFRREDLTRINRQEIQKAFEPPDGQRTVLGAYPFSNHVAEVGETHGHDR